MTIQSEFRPIPLFATSAIAGIILAILAPYGTGQFPAIYRTLFMVGLCLAGGIGTGLANVIMSRSTSALATWQRIAVQSFGATCLVWLCFLGLELMISGSPQPSFFYLIPFYIWVISAVICGVGELMHARKQSDITEDAPVRPAIYERLKPALRNAEIYALSAEDHYVRVHTSRGDDLILMRLSDAVKETQPLRGLQIHRSWWAAEVGVKEAIKQDGKLRITLHNGLTAPVSRSQAKNVKDANWA